MGKIEPREGKRSESREEKMIDRGYPWICTFFFWKTHAMVSVASTTSAATTHPAALVAWGTPPAAVVFIFAWITRVFASDENKRRRQG